jgi:hypothetical protein
MLLFELQVTEGGNNAGWIVRLRHNSDHSYSGECSVCHLGQVERVSRRFKACGAAAAAVFGGNAAPGTRQSENRLAAAVQKETEFSS